MRLNFLFLLLKEKFCHFYVEDLSHGHLLKLIYLKGSIRAKRGKSLKTQIKFVFALYKFIENNYDFFLSIYFSFSYFTYFLLLNSFIISICI